MDAIGMKLHLSLISVVMGLVAFQSAFADDPVTCWKEGTKVFVTARENGKVYAINGTARSMAASLGWIDGKTHYEPVQMSRMLASGLTKCFPDQASAGSATVEMTGEEPQSPTVATAEDSEPVLDADAIKQPAKPVSSPMSVDQFIKAAISGDLVTLKAYIDAGFNVNTKGQGVPALNIVGSPAINEAAAAGQCAAVDLLLGAGASADPRDKKFAFTPLGNASRKGATQCVKSLLAKHVRIDVRDGPMGDTPLHKAAYGGYLEVVKLLVEHGANLTLKNEDGDTAYRAAMVMGNNQVAQYLQSKGGR